MRFITCRLPDGVEDPAILSEDGRQVWPLSWLGLSYETLSEATEKTGKILSFMFRREQ